MSASLPLASPAGEEWETPFAIGRSQGILGSVDPDGLGPRVRSVRADDF